MKNIHLLPTLVYAITAIACTQQTPQTSAIIDNSAISKKAHLLFSENKFDSVAILVGDNIQVINYASGQTFNGKAEFRNFMTGFKTAFPDMIIKHTNVFEDNKGNVALEFEAIGTHTGPFIIPGDTLPATGKIVTLYVSETHRIENGKIVSIHNYQDSGSLLAQLGMLK
ncbi:MAG: ester cyclase [Saprospiraceae bacterium]|nr:ester cyclase [Saprospiraceae bacterium]